jgi:hypothetical protein
MLYLEGSYAHHYTTSAGYMLYLETSRRTGQTKSLEEIITKTLREIGKNHKPIHRSKKVNNLDPKENMKEIKTR